MSAAGPRVAVVHYHLRPGGVTTVIRDQLATAPDSSAILVITGEAARGFPDAAIVDGLGYGDGSLAIELADGIDEVCRRRWGAPADLVHLHNPTLGKNAAYPGLIWELRRRGRDVLLHIHDFPEDGRAGVTKADDPYPKDCHYAVINSRDRDLLVRAGLRPGSVHFLPNMVRPIDADDCSDSRIDSAAPSSANRGSGREGLLYPVRGIRRKNVGEALLLSFLFQQRLTVTLPPRSPADLKRFSKWRQTAREFHIPAELGPEVEKPLAARYAAAAAAVTTSIKEGFGYAFVEGWTAGLPIVGRRVDAVCRDFEAAGLSLPYFYHELPVPTDAFDVPAFRSRWRRAVRIFLANHRREDRMDYFESWLETALAMGAIDFGRLDEQAQREVLHHVIGDPRLASSLLSVAGAVPIHNEAAGLISANACVLLTAFGPEAYQRRLWTVYNAVLSKPAQGEVDRGVILDYFLSPKSFYILGLTVQS